MTDQKPISLGFTSNPGRAPAAGSAQLLNCYAENAGTEQKAQWQIWACDGLSTFARLTGGEAIRAALEVDGTLYVVCSRRIFSVDTSGVETDLGGIATTGPVYMARNRRSPPQIAIVSDGVYLVIESGALTTVSHPISSPMTVDFIDGFFVFSHLDGRISHTESDDATTIDGLAFGAVESSADPCTRVIERQREILAFGTRSTEFFADVGTAPFAFERNQAIEIGCVAPGSVAKLDQTVLFVADDLTVRMLPAGSYQAQRISSHAVERAILDEPNREDIVSVVWRSKGHSFYCISGDTFSWCYDLTTGHWHNRESYGLRRWTVSTVVEFDGRLIAGDYDSNHLYVMSADYSDEDGDAMLVEIITPPVHAWPSKIKFNALHLDMVPGVGLNSYTPSDRAQMTWGGDPLTWGGSLFYWTTSEASGDINTYDPAVMMSYSDDGGKNWSAESTRAIGRLGETMKRIVWRRLGMTRQHGRTFRFRASAAVMRGFMGAAVDAEKLAA